ncbi:MAG: hypothetical protein UT02_C0020G0013 [Parcubacteria group bacterium GW2011_GWC2_38_7]|nr:MAG: hypothetical protein UT02_C0020G0013 [Parcubacteria group bacterium GW2011_GWC2_38_7]
MDMVGYFGIAVLFALVFCICLLQLSKRFISSERQQSELPRKWIIRLHNFSGACLLLWITSALYFDYSYGTIVTYDENGKVVSTSRGTVPCWRFCFDLDGDAVTISGSFILVTENRGSVLVEYKVETWIEDPKLFFEKKSRVLAFSGRSFHRSQHL